MKAKHRNDYPSCRDKGTWVGGNPRYNRRRPTRGMGRGRGYKKAEPKAAGRDE